MRQFRKATIKDVAAKAGVSTATVSYFISGREDVCSTDTAGRIRAAVSELNYAPSSLSRGLRRRSTMTLGLCMLAPSDPQAANGNFFLERLWRGITMQTDAEDYSLLLYPASVREGISCDAFLDGRVDGLLFHLHDNVRTGRLAAAGMPTVLLTRSYDLPDGCGAVWADEVQTLDLALAHLWRLGHRRIAHIAGPVGIHGTEGRPARDIAVQRLEAYTTWMQTHGVYDPALIGYADGWTAYQTQRIVADWSRLAAPPTAAVCVNDAQALGIIAAAGQEGLSVPGDLSVVGVDNSPQNSNTAPALTSVDVPIEEIGREAVRALLRLMHGAPIEHCRTVLPVTNLVVRDSTAAVKTQS